MLRGKTIEYFMNFKGLLKIYFQYFIKYFVIIVNFAIHIVHWMKIMPFFSVDCKYFNV